MDARTEGPRDRSDSQHPPDDLQDGAARWAWIAEALDNELRASLQRALLWTQHLLRHGRPAVAPREGPAGAPARASGRRGQGSGARSERARRGQESIERELREALAFVDDVLVIGCTEWTEGRDPWIRSIVVRDLVEAAVRKLTTHPRARSLEIDTRISPEDLRLVADPDWTLQAVEALLRVGLRSASPGDTLSVEISDWEAKSFSDAEIDGWVTATLDMPRASLDAELHVGEMGSGRPWSWAGAPGGGLPLSLAAVGCYARLLEGRFEVTEVGTPPRIRASIRIPSHRTPEQRPGWIP